MFWKLREKMNDQSSKVTRKSKNELWDLDLNRSFLFLENVYRIHCWIRFWNFVKPFWELFNFLNNKHKMYHNVFIICYLISISNQIYLSIFFNIHRPSLSIQQHIFTRTSQMFTNISITFLYRSKTSHDPISNS